MGEDREGRGPSLENGLWPYRKELRVRYARETGGVASGNRYLFWLECELARMMAGKEGEA